MLIFFALNIINPLSSLYHFYCLLNNTTTIEGWEKDKVATLVKKGRIHEVCAVFSI